MLMFTYVEIYSCTAKRITNMTLLTVLKPNMSLQKDSEVSFSKFLENYKKSSFFANQGQGQDKIADQTHFKWDLRLVPTHDYKWYGG